jgi:hypothetical protein
MFTRPPIAGTAPRKCFGTLLQTTPSDRTWPLPRDTRALLLGGLRARGGQERRLSTPGNLRLAALLGCAIFLSFTAVNYASYGVGYLYNPGPFLYWQPLAVTALILTAAVLPWLASRTVITLGAVAAGTATVAYDLSSQSHAVARIMASQPYSGPDPGGAVARA